MKTLTICYSMTGNNKKLANYLKEKIDCDIFEVRTIKKMGFSSFIMGLIFNKNPKIEDCNLDLKSYDKIIFISPIWFGKLAFPLKNIFNERKIKYRKLLFFVNMFRRAKR